MLIQYIKEFFLPAINQVLLSADQPTFADADQVLLTSSTKPEFGDYQCNHAMSLAKALRKKPYDIAQEIVSHLDNAKKETVFSAIDIMPQGFINLRLNDIWLIDQFRLQTSFENNFGYPAPQTAQKTIVDYSSPNIAKEMHVGHLRSTIIGESIARILEFCGDNVERINHLGDWGTQFGMLIAYLKSEHPHALDESQQLPISDLVQFYKKAKARFDEDEDFRTMSRAEVTTLQGGDPVSMRAWQKLCDISRQSFQEIYDLLGVSLIERGESFYNPLLPRVIQDFQDAGLLKESEGAKCVFPEVAKNREGEILPLMLQKGDGGYTYDTTDLAALKYRITHEKADKIIYVTDKGQSTHFAQVFEAGRMIGWLKDNSRVEHVPFGLVLGEDRKKFKTRSGETVKLADLLQEAQKRALAIVQEKNPDWPEDRQLRIARVIGIGAVKYADLSQNKTSDYIFSFEKMLQLNGNTAPYLIYVYVRIQGIFRKADNLNDTRIILSEPVERELALFLARYSEIIAAIKETWSTQMLADYLFEAAQKFNRFYHDCPVLNAGRDDLRDSRLQICRATADILKHGLSLLGIEVLEQM